MNIATHARLTGAVYLLYFVTAVVGALLAPGTGGPGGLPTDAAANAAGILAHETRYQVGVAIGLVSTVLYVALAGLFYVLLRPVNRTLAVVMAFISVTGCAVTGFAAVFQLAPVVILGGRPFLAVFDAHQLQSLALLFLYLGAEAGRVALAFFAFFQLVWGYLIFRSTFLPRIIGVLIAVAGVGWLALVLPAPAPPVVTAIEVLGFVAEASLMLWLLVMGVDARRWEALAKPASA